MNKLFGYWLMEEATAAADAGGGGTDAPAATGADTTTAGGTPAAVDGGSDGEGSAGEGALGAEDNGAGKEDGDGEGALGGSEETVEDQIDWEKISDEDYLKKVGLPEGQKWDEENMKEYTKLLKQYKIDPKAFRAFVDKSAELDKSRAAKFSAERAQQKAEATKAFKAAGEEFRKEYTPEQVKEMNQTLREINDDTFKVLVAKSPLSNNKTMGKMLLAYRQVYGEAKGGEGAGSASSGEKTFEQVWTGKA